MKTAIITGSNRGLGLGFVKYLLDQNYLVFAGARNIENFDTKLVENKNLVIVQLDVSDNSQIKKAVQEIKKHTDHLDLLINNAGANKDSATNGHKELVCNLKDLDRKSLLKMFDVNTVSPMILAKRCIPLMKNNPSFIINISSNRASFHDELKPSSGNYGYRASKIALNMMTFCSVFDLPKNIKTFAVHPGLVLTDMNPKGVDKPYNQAKKIIRITKNWKEEFNGKFLKYDGSYYPL